MFAPCQRTSPSVAASKPQIILKRLVLPLPFGPVSWTTLPGESEKLRPLKRSRSPLTDRKFATSRIVVRLLRKSKLQTHCIGLFPEKHLVRRKCSWRRTARGHAILSKTLVYSPRTNGSICPFLFFQTTQPPFKTRTCLNPESRRI